jgi:hypothetical protein
MLPGESKGWMTESSVLTPGAQAKHYREQAANARRAAARAKGPARWAHLILVRQWEGLATGIELKSGKVLAKARSTGRKGRLKSARARASKYQHLG